LYGSLVLVPLTGWIHHAATVGYAPIRWPFGQDLPFVPKSDTVAGLFASLHWLFVWTLFASLGLHIAGALKHHVIDRDSTLRRMLPGRAAAPQPPKQSHSAAPLITALAVWGAVLAGGAALGKLTPSHAAQPPAAELAEVQSGWSVENGTLAIEVTQMGSPVSGEFADWTAAITFDDPAAPGPAGTVEVVVSIPSLTLGTVTSQAMGADYFDSTQFPTAAFTADIEKLAAGYEARGTLTIRDQTVPVVLPFTLTLDGDKAEMSGSLALNRLDFGVGQGLADESSLAFAVNVTVDLTAQRAE
jgi:polyisoprenoid-binding protein YceI